MGRKPNADTIRLVAGVTLKRLPRTGIWQLSCSAHSQTIRKSLMTTDETAARLAALDYYQAQREHILLGKAFNRVSFPEAATAYLQTVIGKSKRDYHAETIDRHLLPYFENFKDIRQVTAGKVSDYLVHRRTKNAREPEPQTLNRENTVLRQLLAYAVIQQWLPEKVLVPHINQSLTARRRRNFTPAEYGLLVRTARRRIQEAMDNPRERHVADQRRLLLDAIVIMANSGLRVDELHKLNWRGVLWADGDIQLERAGKRRSNRRLVLNESAIVALKRIAKRRQLWLSRRQQSTELDPLEPVISLPSGIPVTSFKKQFRTLLDACGFEYRNAAERHSLTSLRHTYATRLLTRKHRARPTVSALAKQMGTSTKMIEAHYAHDTVEDYRDDIRGRGAKR